MFTGIEINGVRLPASSGQVYKLKQNSTLFDIGVPKGEYSMPIRLEMDNKTMAALGLQKRINFKDTFKRIPCRLYAQGVFVRNGLLVVEEISDSITGYLLTGMSTLAEQLRTTYLDDVDYGAVIVPGTTESEMVAHMQDTVNNPNNHNHVFASIYSNDFWTNLVNKKKHLSEPYINRYFSGSFFSNSKEKANNSPHVPFPKLKYVIEKIYSYFGWTLEWNLLNDATFEKIVIPNNRALLTTGYLEDLRLRGNSFHTIIPQNSYENGFTDAFIGYVIQGKLDENLYTPYGSSEGLIPGTLIYFENIHVDQSTPAPYIDNDLQFDKPNGRYLIRTSGKLSFDIDIEAALIESGSGAYTFTPFIAQMFFLELSINGKRIAYDLKYFDLSVPVGNLYDINSYTFTIDNLDISDSDVGNYIDIKIGGFGEDEDEENNDVHFIYSNVFKYKVIDLNVKHEKMNALEIPDYEIDYANHLQHTTCSEFLASIRNRFGAYVQNVDFENKKIIYGQLNEVVNNDNKVSFKIRNEFFSKKFITQSHKWKYNFDAGEESLWDKFYNKTIGDEVSADISNEYNFDFGPIFFDYKSYRFAAIKNMTGITKSDDNTEVANFLAIYHGLRNRGDGNSFPLVCSQNNINDGLVNSTFINATPWGLHWREDDGLYATFLENFWKYFVEYMEIEFTVHPNVEEILNFKYEAVDFYHFMKFLVREIDFEIGQEAIRPTKAVMVKLDL